jgi:hypothetical protein
MARRRRSDTLLAAAERREQGGEMRASTIVALSAFSLALMTSSARAEETAAPPDPCKAPQAAQPQTKGAVTIAPVCIKGRPQRPNVAIDVSRLVPRAPLPELRRSFVERIASAVGNDPF